MDKELEIDIEPNLKQYLPSIFLLLGDQKINWKKISLKYQKELNSRTSKLAKTGQKSLEVQASLYDIITKVLNFDTRFNNLLSFINETFIELHQITTDKEKKHLKQTIFNVLINTDNKFFNFIGEFATLNVLKKTGYELQQTEYLLDAKNSNKRIDFFVNKGDRNRLIEVVNIHLPEIMNDEIIERLFAQKIIEKLNLKQKGSKNTFYLFPVLWGPAQDIRQVNDFFNRTEYKFKNTYYPRAYMAYTNEDGSLVKTSFGHIDRL